VGSIPIHSRNPSRRGFFHRKSLEFTEDRTNPLGVMHKAEIVHPMQAERRIVNSTMLVTEGEAIGPDKQREFVTIDTISQKVY
jgi:hypothetical protein